MKLRNIFRILSAGIVLVNVASCHNKEAIFPDYEGGVTAYFAYQYPVRTIALGDSETFDNTLDNEHKCIIYGTMGGAYKGKDVVIDIEVDNSLTDNLYFADGTPVKAMPGHYYDLSSTQLAYGDSHMGGVEVTLHDDFFNDPAAIKNTYVIPVKMTNIVKGADRILTGTPLIPNETPARTNASQWSVAPMDYTLYCIKYANQWDGSWLRRGEDVITGLGAGTYNRHKQYVENDAVTFLETESMNSVVFTSEAVREYKKPVEGYALKLTNETAGANSWDAQVWYSMVNVPADEENKKAAIRDTLKQGNSYILSGMAKGTSDYSMSIFLQSTDHGDQDYGCPPINVTTEWKEFKCVFTVTESTDKAKKDQSYNKIALNFGTFAGTIYLDNLSLVGFNKDPEHPDGGTPVDEANKIYNADFEENYLKIEELNTGWGSWTGVEKRSDLGEGVTRIDDISESLKCDLLLDFADNGDCTISSKTPGITAEGTGKFVKDGAPLAWGNKDRDVLYLQYKVTSPDYTVTTKDTLVSRSREIKRELFVPTYKE